MKNYTLLLLLSTAPLFAGVSAPAPMAPAPCADCEQGWTFGLEVLALKPYQDGGDYRSNFGEYRNDISGDVYDGDWTAAYRASLGYEFSNCVFTKITFFGATFDTIDKGFSDSYEDGNYSDNYKHSLSGDMQLSYLDWVIGKHLKASENLTISPFIGLRWATIDQSVTDKYTYNQDDDGTLYSEQDKVKLDSDFSGLGIVAGADVTYAIGSGFSAYGTFKQSVVWGSQDNSYHETYNENDDGYTGNSYKDHGSDDQSVAVAITEAGLGLQYNFQFSSVAANIRLGAEAQYWTGLNDSSDGNNEVTLAGFVLGANFRF